LLLFIGNNAFGALLLLIGRQVVLLNYR